MLYLPMIVSCPNCQSLNRCQFFGPPADELLVAERAEGWPEGHLPVGEWSDGCSFYAPSDVPVLRCGTCAQLAHQDGYLNLGALKLPEVCCELTLLAHGPYRLNVMKVLRQHTGWSLQESKSFLEYLPRPLPRERTLEETKRFQQALEAVGASCHMAYWDAPGTGSSPEWLSAPNALPVMDGDVLEGFLTSSALSWAQELSIRRALFWQSNEPYRTYSGSMLSPVPWVPLGRRAAGQQVNVQRLLELLSEDVPWQRLLKAEILREHERYDAAIALLTQPIPEAYASILAALLALAQRGVSEVRLLQKPNYVI